MQNDQDPQGQSYRRPYRVPLRGWRDVLARVLERQGRHAVSVLAAGCAFFALFSLVPALTAIVSLYALLADPATVKAHIGLLEGIVPPEAYGMLTQQTARIVAVADSRVVSWSFLVSLGIALWSANACTKTLFAALNVAYGEEERRGFLRFNIATLAFTLAGILALVVIMIALVWVPILFALVGLPEDVQAWVRFGRWPLLAVLVAVGLACLYAFGPARRTAKWQWLSVGSAVAMLAWLLATWGFSIYVENFADYDAMYGSLGAIIVMMFWLYLSFVIVLLGAELNAALELQTSHDTTVGEARPMGERGAYVADRVATPPR